MTKPISARYINGDYAHANPGWHEEDSAWKAALISDLIEQSNLTFSACVDVGCGRGEIASLLAKRYPASTFVGLDVAPVQVMPTPLPNLRYRTADIDSLSEVVDLILVIDVLEHIENYMSFARDVATRCRYAMFHIPLEMNVSAVLRDRQIHTRSKVGHLHYFSEVTALATLQDAGFVPVRWRLTAGALELDSARRPLTRLANPLRRTAQRLSVSWASRILGGYSLLVLARSSITDE